MTEKERRKSRIASCGGVGGGNKNDLRGGLKKRGPFLKTKLRRGGQKKSNTNEAKKLLQA